MVEQPNYTQVPNEFLDKRMALLSANAFKVLMAICRKTFGFHKEGLKDRISNSQLMEMTGIISRQTLYKAVEELGDDVTKTVLGKAIYYSVNVTETVLSSYSNRTIVPENSTETVHTKERRDKEISKETSAVAVVDPLYHVLMDAMKSKNDGIFSNWKREGDNAKRVVAKARAREKAVPGLTAPELLKSVLGQFWKLKQSDKFFASQPFTPSALNSLWDRVLESMRREEVDPEIMAIVKGVSK